MDWVPELSSICAIMASIRLVQPTFPTFKACVYSVITVSVIKCIQVTVTTFKSTVDFTTNYFRWTIFGIKVNPITWEHDLWIFTCNFIHLELSVVQCSLPTWLEIYYNT